MLPRSACAALVLGVALAGAATPALGEGRHHHDVERLPVGADSSGQRLVMVSGHSRHTSDREPGPIAPYVSPKDDTPLQRSRPKGYRIAPGVRYTEWSQTDARGPIRAHLVTVDLDVKGVGLDVVNPGHVAAVDTVLDMARNRSGAVAAVNGDFYDIGKSGAPLGVTRSRARGLLNARASGWNNAFFVTRKGRAQFGQVVLRGSIAQRPDAKVTNLNSHFVLPGGIGIYTGRWGRSPGYSVTQGQTKNVRQVVVRDGRVVSNRGKLTPGRTIDGLVLVGRGEGARQLRKLKQGKADVSWWLSGRPSMVVTGSKLLIDDGRVLATDDGEMHPRTAVGIERDTNQVLILAIDGRQSFSRGYTMVELADMMQMLGADEALNLDGGGSTTMVTRRKGSLKVANSPSDSVLRQVANALVVTYSGS